MTKRKLLLTGLALTAGLALAACGGGGSSTSGGGQGLSGAGATFPAPLYAKWAEAYKAATGQTLNYQAIGSGGGIKQIEAKTVDFGASDKPLKPEELDKQGLYQFPTVMGGVAPIVNLPGIAPGQIKLTGAVLGDIYMGTIKTWNAPQIAALNPGVALPNLPISVVHRADGSGTSFLFTSYLAGQNPTWSSKVGASDAVNWPAGIGGKGNEGVAAYVKQISGGIGYVEYAYALQNKLAFSRMKNAAGNFVQPRDDSFAAAAATADWKSAPDFNVIMTNAPGDAAWPITATTWAIMYKKPKNAAQTRAALDFFKWSFENGKAQAASLDYVPLPDSLVRQIEAYWAQNIKS